MKKDRKWFSAAVKILLAVLAAVVVWQCAGHFSPAQAKEKERGEKEIIREIVYTYYRNQDISSKQMLSLLEELERENQESANKWRGILDCWKEATSQMSVHYGPLADGLEQGDGLCLIVLGFQLNPDGSMRKELINRLEIALESAEKYPQALILCTGGGTAEASNATEAQVMAQWLEDRGIEKERLIVENRSLTTTQNAILSYRILSEEYPQITQAAIISSDYHLPWAVLLFQTQFILGEHPITVASNAACRGGRVLSNRNLLQLQLSGILEIAGIT